VRVVVDYDLCESNGICEGFAPEVFRVDDETDQLVLLQEFPPESLRGPVEMAVQRCPRQALSIDDS
jgi:ferredoxin